MDELRAECMYMSALSAWYMMYCLWISSRMLARISATACRSVSMADVEPRDSEWGSSRFPNGFFENEDEGGQLM